MSNAFAWIDRIATAIGRFVPRLVIVRKTYVAVSFHHDGGARVRPPGIFWYWPLLTAVRMLPTTLRSWVVGGVAVSVSECAGEWRVPVTRCAGAIMSARMDNPLAAIRVFDITTTAELVMRAALSRHWQEGPDATCTKVASKMAEYGYTLVDFSIVDTYERVTFGSPQEVHSYDRTEHDKDGG